MTFEQWAKDRPVGPKGSHGYLMIKAAWEESREECVKVCQEIAIKHSLAVGARASGLKAGALECAEALSK